MALDIETEGSHLENRIFQLQSLSRIVRKSREFDNTNSEYVQKIKNLILKNCIIEGKKGVSMLSESSCESGCDIFYS